MATGAGKTRTVIALCDLLMRCNWVKRVLFLADRVALVNQAGNAFKRHLPDSSPVNLVTETDTEGRVYVSTYPTIMGLIDETRDGQRRFGAGHFDLAVVDEAHRSIFQKYRAIFDYFDALLVGLTATPREEVDRNTYSLFQLENGVPTDAYSLDEAVADRYLVPPRGVSVPLKFQREGIRYDDLSEDERDQSDDGREHQAQGRGMTHHHAEHQQPVGDGEDDERPPEEPERGLVLGHLRPDDREQQVQVVENFIGRRVDGIVLLAGAGLGLDVGLWYWLGVGTVAAEDLRDVLHRVGGDVLGVAALAVERRDRRAPQPLARAQRAKVNRALAMAQVMLLATDDTSG